MSAVIRVYAKVGDNPINELGRVTPAQGDTEVDMLRKASGLMRFIADTFDQMTGAFESLRDAAVTVEKAFAEYDQTHGEGRDQGGGRP